MHFSKSRQSSKSQKCHDSLLAISIYFAIKRESPHCAPAQLDRDTSSVDLEEIINRFHFLNQEVRTALCDLTRAQVDRIFFLPNHTGHF